MEIIYAMTRPEAVTISNTRARAKARARARARARVVAGTGTARVRARVRAIISGEVGTKGRVRENEGINTIVATNDNLITILLITVTTIV